jgi:hypothetical protein
MENIMEKYVELSGENGRATHLWIRVYYDLGGCNVFTYQNEQRGYYLSVTPVTREIRSGCAMVSMSAFSGVKKCVKAVNRKSAKAAAQAAENAQNYIHDLVIYVCNQNGLPVPPQFIYKGEN